MADIQKALYDIQGNRITPETVAEAVEYDNSESGLAATDMQGAVDELEADISDRYTKQQAVQKFAYLEEAEGNSVQIVDAIEAPFGELEVLGETQGLKVIFTPTTVTTTGADFAFSNGATITFSGLATTANNKSAVVTTVSGKTMTFPSATFTEATETVGSITDGTLTYPITVSPDNPQTLTSLTSFDYTVSGKNMVNISTKTYTTVGLHNLGIINANLLPQTKDITLSALITSTGITSGHPPYVRIQLYNDATLVTSIGTGFTTVAANSSGYSKAVFNIRKLKNTYPTFNRILLDGGVSAAATMSGSVVISNIQLEVGSTNTAYEAFIGLTTATVPLKDTTDNQLEARSLPDVAVDYIFKDTDGKWKLKCKCWGGDITAVTLGFTELTTTCMAYIELTLPKNIMTKATGDTTVGVGGYLPYINDYNSDSEHFYGGFFGGTNRIYIYINKSRLSEATLAGMTAYLVAHPLKIIIGLAESYDVELSAADQTALNEIEAQGTFDGTTNIMLSTEVGEVSVEGAKDITKVISDMASAIALLG